MFSKSEPAILLKWPAARIPLASVYFLSPQIVYHRPYGVPPGIPVVLAEEAVPPGQQILDKGTVTGAAVFPEGGLYGLISLLPMRRSRPRGRGRCWRR